jgi:hypothetical protein
VSSFADGLSDQELREHLGHVQRAQAAMLAGPKASERLTRAAERLVRKWEDFLSAQAQGFPVPFHPERSSEATVRKAYDQARDTLLRLLREARMGDTDLRAVRGSIGWIEETAGDRVGARLREWEAGEILRRGGRAERAAARPLAGAKDLHVIPEHREG